MRRIFSWLSGGFAKILFGIVRWIVQYNCSHNWRVGNRYENGCRYDFIECIRCSYIGAKVLVPIKPLRCKVEIIDEDEMQSM